MIRVIIMGRRPDGYLYRIEGHRSGGGIPIHGLTGRDPLWMACRILADGGEPADAVVCLVEEGDRPTDDWRTRTTVGYGSRGHVEGPEKSVGDRDRHAS